MRRQKRVLRPLKLWNPGAIEKWLEDEAAKGWQLTDCGRMLAVFKVIEPGTYRVRLRPQRPETPEARRERGAASREMGWDCTAVIFGDDDYDCEVFYCGDPSAPELDTDPVAWGWAWEQPFTVTVFSTGSAAIRVLPETATAAWVSLSQETVQPPMASSRYRRGVYVTPFSR